MAIVRSRVRKRVTRKRWGALPRRCSSPVNPARLRGTAVHYSGSVGDAKTDHADCAAVWRSFQRFHMAPGGLGVPNGGCDIAYNHGICPHGFTFVGRGFIRKSGANGTTDANDRYLSVVVMGGDKVGRKDVTDEAKQSLRHLIERQRTIYPHARAVAWHSLFVNTGCPGDELRALIKRLFPSRAGL